jgi:Zn-dependent protease
MSVSIRTDHIQIARVIGIPIYLHFSWLIIFGLIVWTLSTGYFPAQYPDLPASSYWAKGLVASLLFFSRASSTRARPCRSWALRPRRSRSTWP